MPEKKRYYIYAATALVILIAVTVTVICIYRHVHSPAGFHALLQQHDKPDIKWPSDSLQSPLLIEAYYKDSTLSYQWTGAGATGTGNRMMLIQMLAFADSLGLNAKDYHADYIKTCDSPDGIDGFENEQRKAETELICTDAALTFLFHVAYGQPIGLSFSRVNYKIDTARILNMFGQLLVKHNWRQVIDSLEPTQTQYTLLKKAYARMSWFNSHYAGIDSIDTVITPAIKANIMLKLKAYGLIDDAAYIDSVSDDRMRSALCKFQTITGLDTTGKLDSKTLNYLKIPLAKRLEEIKRSLNFRRWCARLQEQKFVFVNIAATRLQVNGDSTQALSMRVIAGQADKQTPLFATYFTRVTTYPHWVVPRDIAIREMLPLIISDSNELAKNNMEVMDNQGNILDPATINWRRYSKNNFPFIIRQATGCDDALGVLKFDLSSPYDIYLHDTNAKYLFARKNRLLSHGCVRLEKPLEFAHYLLGDQFDSIDISYLNKCMKNEEPQDIRIKKKVPCIIYYLTADVGETGALEFYRDAYRIEQ